MMAEPEIVKKFLQEIFATFNGPYASWPCFQKKCPSVVTTSNLLLKRKGSKVFSKNSELAGLPSLSIGTGENLVMVKSLLH